MKKKLTLEVKATLGIIRTRRVNRTIIMDLNTTKKENQKNIIRQKYEMC